MFGFRSQADRMKVNLVCFGAMREFLPPGSEGNRAVIELDGGATVGDAVDALGAPRRLVFALLVDGTQAGLERALSDGAEVTIMPPFTGGSRGRLGGSAKLNRDRLGGAAR
jgi:molybdopterin converting factor small subunit